MESGLCTFCNREEETVDHIFWERPEVTKLWNQFQSYKTNWNKFDILFGNSLFDIPLNLILIKADQFIYSMNMKMSFPGFVNFKTPLLHFLHTEEYIA